MCRRVAAKEWRSWNRPWERKGRENTLLQLPQSKSQRSRKSNRQGLYALGIAPENFRYPIRHIVDSHGPVIDLAVLRPP